MALTDQEIDEIAGPSEVDYWDRRVFARAIEFAATAPLLARIAALTAQVEQAAQPVVYVNSANLASAKISRERGGPYDCHTWGGEKTVYHDTPLYTAPPKAVPLTDAQAHETLLAMAEHIETFGDDSTTEQQLASECIRFILERVAANGITPATVEKG